MKKICFSLLLLCTSLVIAQHKNWAFFSQKVNIEEHQNKKFVFSADVKTDDLNPNAAGFLFLDIQEDKNFFFDNMQDRPIISNSWKKYQIEGIINDGATAINLGGMVKNQGFFYYDNLSLKVQEKNGSWTTIPLKNAGFETKVTENKIPSWNTNQKNTNFSYHNSSVAPTSQFGNHSLLIKSHFETAEVPINVTSKKVNKNKEAILIENINLIDVNTGNIQKRNVLIKDGKFHQIKKRIKISDDKTIRIDGSEKWLIPGLIDSHVHLFQSGSLYTRPDAFNATKHRSYNDERLWLRRHAPDILKRYLNAGITTIIDVGGPLYNYKIRDKYNDPSAYPNVYLTGPLISTYQPKAFEIENSPIIKANTPEEAINLVKAQLPYNPDFIKIWFINNGNLDKNYEIVKATIQESHKHDLKVAVHATQLKVAKLALEADADILVHSVREPIDDDFIKMLTSKNITYIPTLMVSDKYYEAFSQKITFTDYEFKNAHPYPIQSFMDYKHLNNPKLFERYRKIASYRTERLEKENTVEASNLIRLQQHNINIATGTDAGNIGTLHAVSYAEEIQRMKNAGLTNLEILQASTINAAKTLSKENEIGSISVSKMADALILNENPIENINALQNISYIIKGGSLYKHNEAHIESPENIVLRQVNAYNLRNIELFLETFSDDVEFYTFPNSLRSKGKKALRRSFTGLFNDYPDLHCEITNTITIGNTVILHEKTLFKKGDDYAEVVAIYEVKNQKISKVYFKR